MRGGPALTLAVALLLAPPAQAQCTDCDGDGYAWPEDCNDANSSTYPGASEQCDGFDTNCGGLGDEESVCNSTCTYWAVVGPALNLFPDRPYKEFTDLAWTGDDLGLAWQERVFSYGTRNILARLDRTGAVIDTPISVSDVSPNVASTRVEWTGSEYGVTWIDGRNQGDDFYFQRITPAGVLLGENLNLMIDSPYDQAPRVLWNGNEYAVAWYSSGPESAPSVRFARFDRAGTQLGNVIILGSEQVHIFSDLAWTGKEFGIAWSEWLDGNLDIHLARVDGTGQLVMSNRRVTTDPAISVAPHITWTGREYGIAWMDGRDGSNEVYLTQLDELGEHLAPDTKVTEATDSAIPEELVWTGRHYALLWREEGIGRAVIYLSLIDPARLSAIQTIQVSSDLEKATPPSLEWTGTEFAVAWRNPNGGINFSRLGCLCREGTPTTIEICDGLDNDCNGQVDNDSLGLDTDADGIPNTCDNCRLGYNPTQTDNDADGYGNACDNCLNDSNPGQADLDRDQRGDICDNCVAQYNPFQDDTDGDKVGDVCDNCYAAANSGQQDFDTDFEGDACDLDDGLLLFTDTFPDAVAWQPEVLYSSFNLYRGSLAVLRSTGEYTQDPAASTEATHFCGLVDAFVYDGFEPAVGQAVFYLVAGIAGGVEDSLGTDSSGSERLKTRPCTEEVINPIPTLHLLVSTDSTINACSEVIDLSGDVLGSSGEPVVGVLVTFEIISSSPSGLKGYFIPSATLSDSTGQYAVSFLLDAQQCAASCVGAPACSVGVRAVAAGVASNTVLITESL